MTVKKLTTGEFFDLQDFRADNPELGRRGFQCEILRRTVPGFEKLTDQQIEARDACEVAPLITEAMRVNGFIDTEPAKKK